MADLDASSFGAGAHLSASTPGPPPGAPGTPPPGAPPSPGGAWTPAPQPPRRPRSPLPFLVAGAGAVIVALVVVLVIVLMGGDDDSNSSSPGATSPGRSSSDAELTSAEERLSTHVPKKNRDTCTHGKSVFDGLVAAVECFPKDSVIDSVVYIQFDSSAAMNTAYEEILTQNSVVRESGGSCSKGEIGEGTYNNEEGRSMCVVDDEGATVVWTDAALNIIGSARNESGDIRGVGEWWSDGPSGPV